MNENFFSDITGQGPEKKTITYRGNNKDVWFRRITGAERIALLKGQTMNAGGEGKPSFKIDLADTAERSALLVQFSACDEQGNPVFKDLASVKALPDDLINMLYKHANDINQEGDGTPPGNG